MKAIRGAVLACMCGTAPQLLGLLEELPAKCKYPALCRSGMPEEVPVIGTGSRSGPGSEIQPDNSNLCDADFGAGAGAGAGAVAFPVDLQILHIKEH